MGFQLPYFESEAEEADWWYDNRELTSAEFLVAAAAGKLFRRPGGVLDPLREPVPPMDIDPEELAAARTLLEKSGIWMEDQPTRMTTVKPGVDEFAKAS